MRRRSILAMILTIIAKGEVVGPDDVSIVFKVGVLVAVEIRALCVMVFVMRGDIELTIVATVKVGTVLEFVSLFFGVPDPTSSFRSISLGINQDTSKLRQSITSGSRIQIEGRLEPTRDYL
ncbi:hypothetical protein BDZ45DRAFT_736666 [Acephala macrosclerotiorum]|nr:hypothetical protein BDZ45DRAFT_736666 [Acephala macrosclerotiorum]